MSGQIDVLKPWSCAGRGRTSSKGGWVYEKSAEAKGRKFHFLLKLSTTVYHHFIWKKRWGSCSWQTAASFAYKLCTWKWRWSLERWIFSSQIRYFPRNVTRRLSKNPRCRLVRPGFFFEAETEKKGWKLVGKTPEGLFFSWGLCARSFGLDVIPGTHQRSHLFCPCWDFEASMVMNSGNQPLRWGWGNPLGKVHRQGLQLFSASGWKAWWIRLS